MLGIIPLEIQKQPSVPEAEQMQMEVVKEHTWKIPIWDYLRKRILPEDKAEARKLRYKAARYVDVRNMLYTS